MVKDFEDQWVGEPQNTQFMGEWGERGLSVSNMHDYYTFTVPGQGRGVGTHEKGHHPILGDREDFPDNITSNLGADKKSVKQKASRNRKPRQKI